jgi:hypothetical protein
MPRKLLRPVNPKGEMRPKQKRLNQNGLSFLPSDGLAYDFRGPCYCKHLVRTPLILTIDAAFGGQYLAPLWAPIHEGEAMKIPLRKLVVVALGVLSVGVFAGRAQITTQLGFKMTQPFTVGNTTLAPGSYVVKPVTGTDQQVIEISGANGKPSVMVDVNSAQPDGSQTGSQLVFNRYKNVLALSEVFPGNGNQGYQLVQGHAEQLAAKTEKPTKQTVTATGK